MSGEEEVVAGGGQELEAQELVHALLHDDAVARGCVDEFRVPLDLDLEVDVVAVLEQARRVIVVVPKIVARACRQGEHGLRITRSEALQPEAGVPEGIDVGPM